MGASFSTDNTNMGTSFSTDRDIPNTNNDAAAGNIVKTDDTHNFTTLPVTKVTVPSSSLNMMSINERISHLSKSKLIDQGGSSAYKTPDIPLIVQGHPHGFIAAVTSAFKDHYPLSLRPQHFWLLILQGIAIHVDQNAEELRSKWVAHEGKKTLEVRCDEFSLGTPNNWESVVEGKPDSFSIQIDKNTNPSVMENLVPKFSDTSAIENIAIKITVMDICKNYFSYKCSTMCGFPSITLEGTESDWLLLITNAESLIRSQCTKKFADFWLPSLIPLLKKIHSEYCAGSKNKTIDSKFWNSMCKRGGTNGSGARTWFNGWFNIFFPFIENHINRYCEPYSPSNGYVKEGLVWDKKYGMFGGNQPNGVQGPDCEDFPNGLGRAPVIWQYLSKEIKLSFNAGFIGAHQDPETLTISPHIGWFITKGEAEKEDKEYPFGL
jgi:hypothetical protein